MNLAILALSTSVLFAQAPSQADDDLAEQVRLAKRDVDSGEYAKASQRLAQLVEAGHFQSQDLRSEAYRLLGISLILQQPPRPEEAKNAFREVLLVDPDTELDPFYVPQRVVDFFDQEKKELEPQLAPIRAQKRAERDVRRKQLEAEAAKRREEEQQRRIRSLQPNVERRVIQREFWVSLLPFGGAVDAAIHFKPETQLQDKLLVPPAPGAPTGSLHPEERRAPRHAKAEPVTASYEGAP